jgi:hypothetical protein
MTSFISSLWASASSHIDCLQVPGAKAQPALEVRAMADVVYLGIGVLFFVLMGVYAVACDRL